MWTGRRRGGCSTCPRTKGTFVLKLPLLCLAVSLFDVTFGGVGLMALVGLVRQVDVVSLVGLVG